jgi:hypothetical protein
VLLTKSELYGWDVGSQVVNRGAKFDGEKAAACFRMGLGRENLPWFAKLLGFLEAGVMGTLMLMCAVAASLALGVLVAYGVCQLMFRIFRVHATAVAKERVAAATVGRVAVNS